MRGHEGRALAWCKSCAPTPSRDAGADTIEANAVLGLPIDARRYDAAVCMLRHLGVQRLRLLTNNPLKVAALQDLGLEVVARESVLTALGPDNERYLRTKADQMGPPRPGPPVRLSGPCPGSRSGSDTGATLSPQGGSMNPQVPDPDRRRC